jgi:ketosteroid isomerase-like protein
MTDLDTAIRARRADSNAAIAARDPDRVTGFMLHDVTVAVAGGPVLVGRKANRDAFATQFADRNFRGYVRTPTIITPADLPTHATERGHWVGRWQNGRLVDEMRGTYSAVWRHTEVGWLLESEIFE